MLLFHPPFAFLSSSRVLGSVGFQMLGVAVGWQLYELTGSALDLGLVGLVQFVPMVLLTLVVGQVADRCDRRLVVVVCEVAKAGSAAALAFGSLGGWQGRASIFTLVGLLGAAQAFENPDAMRGRVSAVHSLFTGTSNQLGAFESGVAAALLGVVPAVLLGELGTVAAIAGCGWSSSPSSGISADSRNDHAKPPVVSRLDGA